MNKNVFVFCEQRDGEIQKVAFELVGKARELADALGQEVVAVLAGSNIEAKAAELIAHGADKVVVADDPMLAEYSTKPYTEVMEKVIADYAPEVVLFGASSIGRDLAPSVSATVHTGLTADCTSLAIGDVDKTVTNAADKAKVEAKIAELGQDVTVTDNSRTVKGKDGLFPVGAVRPLHHIVGVEIGAQAGDKPTDVTDLLAQADFNIYKTDFAAQGAGFLVVTGYAESMHVDMRMSFWADTNQVLLQLRDDMAIAGSGTPQVYNHFMDALEIWGHITTVKRGMGKEA